jgi:hypothetical protein
LIIVQLNCAKIVAQVTDIIQNSNKDKSILFNNP